LAKSTAVAVPESNEVALAAQQELEASLASANQANIDQADIQIPLLKIGQALTDEVSTGDANAGEFINALTREGIGREIEFVVAGFQKGRFDHGDRKAGLRARKSYGSSVVPWTDDPYVGQPFSEHPDAEETYSKRVNNGDMPWGKGPRISTTYDFTGHVISGLGEDEEPIPVCLSLMRTNTRSAKNWTTLLNAVLRGRYWDEVCVLSTEQTRNNEGNYYTINVRRGRKTTAEERQRAVNLALVLRDQTVAVVGEDDSSKPVAEPQAEGGLAV
jgi:hypothetical protein